MHLPQLLPRPINRTFLPRLARTPWPRPARPSGISTMLAVVFSFFFAASAQGVDRLPFASYGQFKQETLDLLATSQRSIWIASEQCNDGDIMSALYLARYRQVRVYVLLNQDQAQQPTLFNRLHQDDIPVALAPPAFFQAHKSLLQVDGKVYLSEVALSSFLPSSGAHKWHTTQASEFNDFQQSFFKYFTAEQSSASRPVLKAQAKDSSKDQQAAKARSSSPPIAKRLPKIPKWQKQASQP